MITISFFINLQPISLLDIPEINQSSLVSCQRHVVRLESGKLEIYKINNGVPQGSELNLLHFESLINKKLHIIFMFINKYIIAI